MHLRKNRLLNEKVGNSMQIFSRLGVWGRGQVRKSEGMVLSKAGRG